VVEHSPKKNVQKKNGIEFVHDLLFSLIILIC